MNEIDEIKKQLSNLKTRYPKTIYRYPENLKEKILKQCKIDGVNAISKLLNIHPSTIYGWITPSNKDKLSKSNKKNTDKTLQKKIDFEEPLLAAIVHKLKVAMAHIYH